VPFPGELCRRSAHPFPDERISRQHDYCFGKVFGLARADDSVTLAVCQIRHSSHGCRHGRNSQSHGFNQYSWLAFTPRSQYKEVGCSKNMAHLRLASELADETADYAFPLGDPLELVFQPPLANDRHTHAGAPPRSFSRSTNQNVVTFYGMIESSRGHHLKAILARATSHGTERLAGQLNIEQHMRQRRRILRSQGL
jgi:hypothetical protein